MTSWLEIFLYITTHITMIWKLNNKYKQKIHSVTMTCTLKKSLEKYFWVKQSTQPIIYIYSCQTLFFFKVRSWDQNQTSWKISHPSMTQQKLPNLCQKCQLCWDKVLKVWWRGELLPSPKLNVSSTFPISNETSNVDCWYLLWFCLYDIGW